MSLADSAGAGTFALLSVFGVAASAGCNATAAGWLSETSFTTAECEPGLRLELRSAAERRCPRGAAVRSITSCRVRRAFAVVAVALRCLTGYECVSTCAGAEVVCRGKRSRDPASAGGHTVAARTNAITKKIASGRTRDEVASAFSSNREAEFNMGQVSKEAESHQSFFRVPLPFRRSQCSSGFCHSHVCGRLWIRVPQKQCGLRRASPHKPRNDLATRVHPQAKLRRRAFEVTAIQIPQQRRT